MIQKIINFFKCLFCKKDLQGQAFYVKPSEDKEELVEKVKNLEKLSKALKQKKNGN
jgi:hypothetical protein